MISTRFIFILVMILLVGSMHDKFVTYHKDTDQEKHYELVRKYLLNKSSLARSKLPIMWIHVQPEVNARWWENFYSRNTKKNNQPYVHLTIKNMVDKCGESFNICMIDDSSFTKIIPGWNTDMTKIATPILENMRELAFSKILSLYGGVLMPSTYVCFKNFIDIYNSSCGCDGMFVGEFVNRKLSSSAFEVFPNTRLMGCKKNCKTMNEYSLYLERIISSDFTHEGHAVGHKENWCSKKVGNGEITLVKAELLGDLDVNNKSVTLDRLMADDYISLHPQAIGVYIPEAEIRKRTAYQWFARLSAKQVLESNTFIGKLLLTKINKD